LSPERPSTTASVNIGDDLNGQTQSGVKVQPGRPGFSGSKLKVSKKS